MAALDPCSPRRIVQRGSHRTECASGTPPLRGCCGARDNDHGDMRAPRSSRSLPMNSAINLVGKSGNYTAIAAFAFYSNYFPIRDTVNVALRAAVPAGGQLLRRFHRLVRVHRPQDLPILDRRAAPTGIPCRQDSTMHPPSAGRTPAASVRTQRGSPSSSTPPWYANGSRTVGPATPTPSTDSSWSRPPAPMSCAASIHSSPTRPGSSRHWRSSHRMHAGTVRDTRIVLAGHRHVCRQQ